MEKEILKDAIATISAVFGQIADLLRDTSPLAHSATDYMLRDSEGVERYAEKVLSTNSFTQPELNTLLGVARGFSLHLSDVEQTVYEEAGGEVLDQIDLLVRKKSDAYNFIHGYPTSGEHK